MRLSVGATTTVDDGLQFGLGQPEVTLRFDRRALCGDPLPCFRQQRKHVVLHARETKLHLVRDDLSKRQDFALVVPGDVVGGTVYFVGIARLGPNVHGFFGQKVEGQIVGFDRLPDADLSAVEYWNLKLQIESALGDRTACIGRSLVDSR